MNNNNLKEIRLLSAPMINTPGLFKWLLCVYRTDPQNAIRMLSDGYQLSYSTAEDLLSGKIEHQVDGDKIIFQAESR